MQYAAASAALSTAYPLRCWSRAMAVENGDMTAWSIAQIQQQMRVGQLSARALTEAYLQRIAEVDQSGPAINSIIEMNPDAIEIAQRLDDERAAGAVRGPLHGVPVLIKDNIDTADSMQTTAGSLALEGRIAVRDAHVVERMRAAGAVLFACASSASSISSPC